LNTGARHFGPHTIADYLNTLHKFEDYSGDDPWFVAISQNDIQESLAAQKSLSNGTLLNYHTGLSALWGWAVKEQIVSVNFVKGIQPPRPDKREIVPFTETEIKALLSELTL
jgi:site-specific recombinase XerD